MNITFRIFDSYKEFVYGQSGNVIFNGPYYTDEEILEFNKTIIAYDSEEEFIELSSQFHVLFNNKKINVLKINFFGTMQSQNFDALLKDYDETNSVINISVPSPEYVNPIAISSFATRYNKYQIFIFISINQLEKFSSEFINTEFKWADSTYELTRKNYATEYHDGTRFHDGAISYGEQKNVINLINETLGNADIQQIVNSKEFYFQYLKEEWNEFERLALNDVNLIRILLGKYVPYRGIHENLDITFEDLLKKFTEKESTFQQYFQNLKPGYIEYSVFRLIGEIIAYFDDKGYNKLIWNKYEDKRTVSRSNVRQQIWVKALLNYKKNNNTIQNINSKSIQNAILFLKNPSQRLSVLSDRHREKISVNFMNRAYNRSSFDGDVMDFFDQYKIELSNEKNRGYLISTILYSPLVKDIWDPFDEENEIEPEDKFDNIVNEKIKDIDDVIVHKQRSFTISEGNGSVIGVNELAAVMANLLIQLKESDKGKMVGVFGHWGRGKTFLMDKIWEQLQSQSQRFYRIDFHAWKYQDTPASWAYLYEAFSEKYFASSGKKWYGALINKLLMRMDLNCTRIGIIPILFFAISILASILSFIFIAKIKSFGQYLLFFGIISTTIVSYIKIAKKSFSENAKDIFRKYFTHVSFSKLLGIQSEIQSELKILISHWLKNKRLNKDDKKILLFVDDIDRCCEDRIIQIIDALRVMLEDDEISKKVIVIAAIDERVLKRAIGLKYHELLEKDFKLIGDEKIKVADNIAKEYMDKLFLAGINLGILTYENRKDILKKYINNRVYIQPLKQTPVIENSLENHPNILSSVVKNIDAPEIIENTAHVNPAQKLMEITVDGKDYDLFKSEEECLLTLMEIYDEATPRQIRIFYYRYLLARNLLLKQNENGINITKRQYIQFNNLAKFLLHYTVEETLDVFRKTKNILYQEKDKGNRHYSISVLKSVEAFNVDDLIEIYSVLDIVLAY